MSIDDTELDSALRHWGAEHRSDAPGSAPPIADLLATRRRRHTVAAVAASVVLVAALALGLGLGLRQPTRTSLGDGTPSRTAASTGATTAHSSGPCWQRFTDAGSHIDPHTLVGDVVLHYTGDTNCMIFEQAQLALVNAAGSVVGPHQPTVTYNPQLLVRPGQTIRFVVRVYDVCLGVPNGRYSLLVGLRPVVKPDAESGVVVPIGDVRFSTEQVSCALLAMPAVESRARIWTSPYPMTALHKLTSAAHSEAVRFGFEAAPASVVRTHLPSVAALLDLGPRSSPRRVYYRDTEVWLIQMRGSFVCTTCPVAPGARKPRGSVAEYVITAGRLQPMYAGVTSKPADLSRLGTVVPLLP